MHIFFFVTKPTYKGEFVFAAGSIHNREPTSAAHFRSSTGRETKGAPNWTEKGDKEDPKRTNKAQKGSPNAPRRCPSEPQWRLQQVAGLLKVV